MYKRNLTPSALILFLVVSFGASKSLADPLLNGVATHTELGQEQFIAGLYTSTLSTNRNDILVRQEDKRMQVRVTADSITPRRFRRMWIEGMAINASSEELEKHSEDMASFSNMLRVRLAVGDIFTVDRTGTNVNIIINGSTLGTINDPAFFDLLLRTWIGPVPLSSNFRESLLKAGDVDSDLLARFEATRPTDERIAAIENAIQRRPAPAAEQMAQAEPPQVNTPAIAPPVISAPVTETAAIAPPDLTVAAPQQPRRTQDATAPTPRPTAVPTPKPSPKPTQVAVAPRPTPATTSGGVLDEEDEEEFTASGLLKQQLYIAQLKRWSNKFTEYPRRALERNQQGTVRVSVTIDRQGRVQNAEVIEETKYSLLNRGAIDIVEKASPYPVVPDDIKGENFTFSFPILFQIKSD